MSRNPRYDRTLALALAALLGGTILVAPGTAEAQAPSPEHALLNKVEAAPQIAWPAPRQTSGNVAGASRPVDGEGALLGRSASGDQPAILRVEAAPGFMAQVRSIDGEQALLGRGAIGERQRVELAAEIPQASRASSSTDE